MNQRSKISAFVICCNQEKRIKDCLESIKFCDEIVVVDSGSTDKTVEICKQYTPKVFFNEWKGYVDQKKFALDKCSNEWVLNIDTDERVSPELKEEVLHVLSSPPTEQLNGYDIPRIVNYLGLWWDKAGWRIEYRLRFGKRANLSWGGSDPHEKALVTGSKGKLTGKIYHYTYDSLTDQVTRLNRHSTTAAVWHSEAGQKFSVLRLIFSPIGRFLKFYFLKNGYRQGLAGFIVGINEAFYAFLKYAKLWEKERPPTSET